LCLFLGLQSASFSHLDTLPSAKLTRNGKPFTLIYIIEHDLNMTWLEKQTFIEKDLKAMTGDVTKELLDDLMPQIRLAALENSGIAAVDIRLTFDLSEKAKLQSEGSVYFPAKKATVTSELK
jgi:hypothetical protein